MRLPLLLLASCGLSTTLICQGVVPPLQVGLTNPFPGLSAGPVPGGNVQQVHLIHLPSDPPNVFYCAMTVGGLQSTYGGVGGSDLLCGTYDVIANTFTPNNDAAALNTTGTEFGLMIHSNGLHAVFDRLPGAPWLASRANLTSPWTIVGQIGPIPGQSYYDPSIANYHGQPHLLHVLGTSIAMTPINVTNAQLTGASVTIVFGSVVGATANSPTPVCDPNGELIGVSHHDLVGNDNDHWMSLDLDPNTPAVLMHDATSWRNNGGFIGGRFFDAEYLPAPYHVIAIDTFWFTGGRASPGTTMYVRMFAPPTAGTEIYLSAYVASFAFLPAGVPFPGLNGLVGINSNGGVASALILHNNQDGEAIGSFNVPNWPGLIGLRLPAQSATLEAASGSVYIGNTASIVVD